MFFKKLKLFFRYQVSAEYNLHILSWVILLWRSLRLNMIYSSFIIRLWVIDIIFWGFGSKIINFFNRNILIIISYLISVNQIYIWHFIFLINRDSIYIQYFNFFFFILDFFIKFFIIFIWKWVKFFIKINIVF